MKNSGLLFLLLFLLVTTFKSKGEEQKIVYQIDIKKEIDNTTRIYLRNGLEEAKSLGADAILLHMEDCSKQRIQCVRQFYIIRYPSTFLSTTMPLRQEHLYPLRVKKYL